MLRFPYTTRRGNTPGYKGVRPSHQKFIAQVYRHGKRYHLGTYPTEPQAAVAVNQALAVLFPELPPRFLNDIPLDNMPTIEEQEGIEKEVMLRLAVVDPHQQRPLVSA